MGAMKEIHTENQILWEFRIATCQLVALELWSRVTAQPDNRSAIPYLEQIAFCDLEYGYYDTLDTFHGLQVARPTLDHMAGLAVDRLQSSKSQAIQSDAAYLFAQSRGL